MSLATGVYIKPSAEPPVSQQLQDRVVTGTARAACSGVNALLVGKDAFGGGGATLAAGPGTLAGPRTCVSHVLCLPAAVCARPPPGAPTAIHIM